MKTSTKLLIGVGVLGAGYLAYKMLTKPKPAPAPGGTVNEALNNTVQNVQTVPKNVKPGALIASTGAKNLLDKLKQNVASPTVTKPAFTSVKPIIAVNAPTVKRPGVNQFGIKYY